MAPRVGVVLFPGSNCELDAIEAVRDLGGTADVLWHGDTSLGGVDAVIVPGGFAHGDYLRPGAIARFSPVMDAAETLAMLRGEDRVVVRYVDNPNGFVDDIAGVCNEGRNVVGLMPHPERACHPLVGSTDGVVLLRSLLATASAGVSAAQA